jgi:DNA-binding transcriptional LysR family regulator
VIERLRQEFPSIVTKITVMQSKQVAEAIVAGEVDFGLMLHPQSSRELLVRAHTAIHVGFVTLPGHPIARHAQARFSDCALYPIIAPTEPLAVCEPIRSMEAATGVTIRSVASSDNIEMIKSLVKRGVGVGLLSWLDVTDEVTRGELVFTRFANAAAYPLTLALCVDRARQLSAAARLLLGWMETTLDDSGQG